MSRADAVELPPEVFDLVELEKEYIQRHGFRGFVKLAWHILEPGTPLIWGWHLDAVCDHVEALLRGTLGKRNLLIAIPPGTAKSLISSVLSIAWQWGPGERPVYRVLCASYSGTLSTRDAVRCRRLVESPWYQERWPEVQLVHDQNQKCLALGSMVHMADGSMRRIEHVRPGDLVLSYDIRAGRICTDRVVNSWSNGIQKTMLVTLGDGSSIRATENHRFRSWDEWGFVRDLKPGDAIGVAKTLPHGNSESEIDDAFLLALWLSEGSKKATSFEFTSIDQKIISRVSEIAERRGWRLRRVSDMHYRVVADRRQFGDTPMGLLKKHIGATYDGKKAGRGRLKSQTLDQISIPASVMRMGAAGIGEFLGTYIACDGCVNNSTNKIISIASVSERIIRDIQLLLKRLGVRSRVFPQQGWYNDKGARKNCRKYWTVAVASAQEILKLKGIPLYAKSPRMADLVSRIEGENRRHSGGVRACIPPAATSEGRWKTPETCRRIVKASGDAVLTRALASDLEWRPVKSVEEFGEEETWHLETEKTHLYFVEGMLSHNTRYETTQTGLRVATSVGGTVTGDRGNLIVCDDLLSVKRADSDAHRREASDFFWTTLPTRLNDQRRDSMLVIAQRLHQADTIGEILERVPESWEQLILPMRFEPARRAATSLGWSDPRQEDGELLAPEQFPEAEVAKLEAALRHAAPGQLQQRPAPREGAIVKLAWLQYRYRVRGEKPSRVVLSLDCASKASERNDPTAAGVFAEFPDRFEVWHVDVRRHEFPALVRWVKDLAAQWSPHAVLIEDKDAGQQLIQQLRSETVLPVVACNPGGLDKVTRMDAETRVMEAGKVWLPESAPWVQPYVDELTTFPAAAHDDQADMTSQALKWFRETAAALAVLRPIVHRKSSARDW